MDARARLAETARTALRDVLAGADRVALVNFPNHGNPGDPLIWLGTEKLLGELGVDVAYRAASWDYDPAVLRRAVGDAPVLINGGGNLGDLYGGQQGTRERVLAELRDNRVVQMPQSIHFRDPARAERMSRLVADHGGVTLMVRERRSLALARELFGVEATLSPDHALGMGPLERPDVPASGILWLTRRAGDVEHMPGVDPPPGADVRHVEWLDGVTDDEARWDRAGRLALAVNRRARAALESGRPWPAWTHALVSRTYDPLARRWVERGVRILCSGQVVVTDRLHGHVLCVLLGLEHVVLDNAYGKVSGTLDAWTAGLPGVHRASDGAEALAIATKIREAAR